MRKNLKCARIHVPLPTMRRFSSSARRRSLMVAYLISGISRAAAGTPPAPGEVNQLEPMEVTAQKRVQSLHEVPLALTAYTGVFLETSGITQLRELAPFVPGLFIQEQSPNYPGINLRGIKGKS